MKAILTSSYLYSVISVIDKRLPGHTKKWTITHFVDGQMRFLHSWAAPKLHVVGGAGRRLSESMRQSSLLAAGVARKVSPTTLRRVALSFSSWQTPVRLVIQESNHRVIRC